MKVAILLIVLAASANAMTYMNWGVCIARASIGDCKAE